MKVIKALIALGTVFVASAAMAQTKVTLGYTGEPDFAAAFVAKEEGYFEKHGLDVKLRLIPQHSKIPASLQSGSVQIGAVVPIMLLQAVDNGLDLVGVANASVSDTPSKNPVVMVRTGSNIKLADNLVGRKVGMPGIGGPLHVLTLQWLMDECRKECIGYHNVTFIDTPPHEMSELLKEGTVDAVIVTDPFVTRIEQAGTGVVMTSFTRELPRGFSNTLYAASRDWANANPDTVESFREALVEAIAFVESEPQKTRAHISKYLQLSPSVVKTLPIPKMVADLAPSHLDFWRESMRQQKILKKTIDLDALVVK